MRSDAVLTDPAMVDAVHGLGETVLDLGDQMQDLTTTLESRLHQVEEQLAQHDLNLLSGSHVPCGGLACQGDDPCHATRSRQVRQRAAQLPASDFLSAPQRERDHPAAPQAARCAAQALPDSSQKVLKRLVDGGSSAACLAACRLYVLARSSCRVSK